MKDTDWWRVEITCRGVFSDGNISFQVPLFDTARRTNIVVMRPRDELPTDLVAVIKNGMAFHAEVPVAMQHAFEFKIRKVELPQ